MENKRVLVIIPTFDELENLTKLLPRVLEKNSNIHVLIVDDNSPDGTAKWVRQQAELDSRIKLIERNKKMGLGTAYITGFKYALQNGYDYIFEMDADFSHNPKEIKNFLKEIANFDLVLGSRYKIGVNVINWPLRRLMLSLFANAYTRFVTGMPIHDATSGFKCFRKEVLQAINLDEVKSNGYAFQIEMTFKAWKKGFKIKEISIVFTDRVKGKSKMSKKIVREAIFMVWKLRWASMFGNLK